MSGTIADRCAAHDHVVGFYRHDDELVDAITTFLSEGLDVGGAAVVIATPAHRIAFEAALAARGFSIEALIESGRYRSLDAEDTLGAFMRDDEPDADLFASAMGAILQESVAGDCPVRAFGEMVALLWDAGNVAGAIELESLWNDLAATHTFALHCAYSLSSLEESDDLAAAKLVCEQHSKVMSLSRHAARGLASEHAGDSDEFIRLFLPSLTAVGEVRGFVGDVLALWGEDELVREVEVIASELATNAVVHARSPFRVFISRSMSEIRIAVHDGSSDLPEHVGDSKDRSGGRGVALVAALSRAWDTQPAADGKVIWATLTSARREAGPL